MTAVNQLFALQPVQMVLVVSIPWLYARGSMRLVADHGISTTKNLTHPWKVPPAELVVLAGAFVGWGVVVGLSIVWPFS